MSGWRQRALTLKVLGYRDGWRGVFEHLWDVLRGRPCRSMRDMTFTIWARDKENLMVADAQVTLPENRSKAT